MYIYTHIYTYTYLPIHMQYKCAYVLLGIQYYPQVNTYVRIHMNCVCVCTRTRALLRT